MFKLTLTMTMLLTFFLFAGQYTDTLSGNKPPKTTIVKPPKPDGFPYKGRVSGF